MSHEQVVIVVRAGLAAVLGFFIGWERHAHGSPAGDRTYALVALGASAFATIATTRAGSTSGQVIAGVATGIGFLGVGVIVRQPEGAVRGLTSAAGLWVTAAIGIVAGIGEPLAAVALAAIALLLLAWDRLPVLQNIGPHESHPGSLATTRDRDSSTSDERRTP